MDVNDVYKLYVLAIYFHYGVTAFNWLNNTKQNTITTEILVPMGWMKAKTPKNTSLPFQRQLFFSYPFHSWLFPSNSKKTPLDIQTPKHNKQKHQTSGGWYIDLGNWLAILRKKLSMPTFLQRSVFRLSEVRLLSNFYMIFLEHDWKLGQSGRGDVSLWSTLPETNSSPLKKGHSKRKRSYSNRWFPGAMFVSGRIQTNRVPVILKWWNHNPITPWLNCLENIVFINFRPVLGCPRKLVNA